ncbi:uncharacterized protein MYCFIDRAFT_87143 [Pseudocercospora fijiensis CIRAD86]|uniref:Ca3427-like PBP 2 domain-containing protein n=1 Tax=Pseudocercospora fijiensis (strain CIRAD86) TaxID=383855 RepID=M2YV82_PSEFD|nr:uncharacterized protein MYCFIDRAFT_87143 [Pseudocercospora fijiensis CIRAD86]EME81630.1 hypothetical protein MYCFIDRAFT_87143 [Pseudocercospora fijiensis CIRAD86]
MPMSNGFQRVSRGLRSFSSTRQARAERFRVGYIPEHFRTPLAFAQKHYQLNAELVPFPTGTGALASALRAPRHKAGSIEAAVGLTEGFVADLGKDEDTVWPPKYRLLGTYVESPLRWAIVTGAQRSEINDVSDLKGKRVGVSRIGSGSHVMSFVLAEERGWLEPSKEPFDVVPIGDFAALRKSVGPDTTSDFFMWEHFTTKHFWDTGELKRIGERYTPWPSWMIAARTHDGFEDDAERMIGAINDGIAHYRKNKAEAVEYITSTMRYSKEDAQEWMKTVVFPEDVRGVKDSVMTQTVSILQEAGVLPGDIATGGYMILQRRQE